MDTTAAGGSPGAPGSGTEGGAGGQPGAGGEAQSGAEGASQFKREELNPVLRGLSPNEMNELFETMTVSLRAQAARPAQEAGGGGWGAWGQPGGQPASPEPMPAPMAPAPAPQPGKRLDSEGMKKMLDPNSPEYDPATAFHSFVQQNYGSVLGGINQRSIRGLMMALQQTYPDLPEYEQDMVRVLSTKHPLSITDQDVVGAYVFAKGARITAKETEERRKKAATATLPPSAPKTPEKKEVVLSDEEKRAARVMFRRHADPEKAYKEYAAKLAESGGELRVPIGGGQYA